MCVNMKCGTDHLADLQYSYAQSIFWIFVNGFEKDETLEAVESWADTVPALGGEGA